MAGMDPQDGVEIREAGLLIRPWAAADADAVFRACQDPDIQRWTAVPRPYLRHHAVDYVTTSTARAWAEGTGAHLAVVDPATDEVLGACGLVSLDLGTGIGELGYWTAPWARGRGVATGAARAVCRWALGSLGLRRVLWRAEVGNHSSRLIAARLGFRSEGLQRQSLRRGDGSWADGWAAALLPGELLEAGDVPGTRPTRRARLFGGAQPTVPFTTAAGAPGRLRPLRDDDLAPAVLACRDPLTVQYTTVPSPYRDEDAAAFVHTYAPGVWQLGVEAVFAVADDADAFVGTMAMRLPGDAVTTPIGDVGYLIAPWARGRGYAPAALRALCEWGFAELELERIEWRAYVGNEASRRTAERAGFTVEGLLRASLPHRGTVKDAWLGARLVTDDV
jgi:RimJ/RimL family protein N-acetyltransferase